LLPEVLGAAPASTPLGSRIGRLNGTTDATYEQARAAMARGAHSATHVYNAMRPFSIATRVIGAVLTSPDVMRTDRRRRAVEEAA